MTFWKPSRGMPRIHPMSQRACPFASPSIAEHLARGTGAAVLLVLTYMLFHGGGGVRIAGSAATLAGAIALMRGCPTCWTIGLLATIGARARQTAETSSSPVASRPASVPAPR